MRHHGLNYLPDVKIPLQSLILLIPSHRPYLATSTMALITVVGAGVSGLTCALQLLRKGHKVTILGRHIPGDIDIEYTSPFAGANWSSFAKDDETWIQEVDTVGYHIFMDFARSEPNTGIHIVPHHEYLRATDLGPDGKPKLPWFKDLMENFRILEKSELPEGDEFVTGFTYDTVTITTTIYLNWLLQQIYSLGGILKRKDIKHINEAFGLHDSGERADLVINCSALGARFLGGVEDKKVFPIRGQILQVRNTATKQVSVHLPDYAGESFYMFPRKEGGAIIGGTFLLNDWSSQPDPGLTKRIIERAKKYVPEMLDPKLGNPSDIEVFRENVGHRPARKGGVRVEREGKIIHNYGIGGAGYQASWGLAEKVLKLVDSALTESKL
ncbi:CYFA0S01e08064g1_1 [Cyberlindnera fabianii]|uniref:CYFA0S01e08064g1_1 n=1 Tax=Cyberlindnera fabianii TaxID=36022 RepID=A0A061AP77_CYBFA|nr:CYFA0S01e08064g1_1 [Cyberlindnera fabianii]